MSNSIEDAKLPTVTVGIPAYNEEANISNVLNCILEQRKGNYILEKVVVVSDGSTDATVKKVQDISKDHPEVMLVAKSERKGKAECLNNLCRINTSDIFIAFDADLFLSKDIIEKMIASFHSSEISLVSANSQPMPGESFTEKVIVAGKKIWYEIRKDYRGGKNIYNVAACALALRRSFIKNLRLPSETVSEQQFIYLAAKNQRRGFIFAKEAVVYYRAPTTVEDFFIQASHLKEKYDLVTRYFGSAAVAEEHRISLFHKIPALIRALAKDPFYGSLALFLQPFLWVAPENGRNGANKGMWQAVPSTKIVGKMASATIDPAEEHRFLPREGSDSKQRSLHVVFLDFDDIRNPLLAAGQAKATLEVGKCLARKGHRVTVISSRFPGYKDREEEGIEYRHIGLGSGNIRLNNIFYILSVPLAIRGIKADIIVECFTAPISVLLAPLFTRVPVVALPSSFDAERFSSLYHLPFDRIEKFGCRFYKYFLPYTPHLKEKMENFNPAVISKIVPEGVEKDFFRIEKKDPKSILFLGRLDMDQKGIDLLLRSYAKIKKEIEWPLVIAGNGPDEKKIKSLIEELDLSGRVEMVGATYGEKKLRYLSEALFIAFPSRNEGFSLFALEALASGLPLVAFDIPGLSWNNGNVALKVKPFDTEAYAAALKKASTDQKMISEMSREAREFARQFTWEKVSDQFESFFFEVIDIEKKAASSAHPALEKPDPETKNTEFRSEKIMVTKPYLPEKKEYFQYLEKIWDSRWLTNNGVFVRELEKRLKEYLGVKHLFFVTSGTMGLQIAIKSLGLKKEIITTPFSYAATVNAVLWENCKPVFADIDERTLSIDPEKIRQAITPDTEAILGVHVFGNPCSVKTIENIAKENHLKVIYDAAHAFGTRIGEKSVLEFGDISVLSFHATKVFHTGEGGAIITNDDFLAERVSSLRNFGQNGDKFEKAGINGKNSEFHAALGLCMLPKMPDILKARKKIVETYDRCLAGLNIEHPVFADGATRNFTYYPLIFKSEEILLRVIDSLSKHGVFPRRYFYPSLNTLPFTGGAPCPISESISKRILCLPLYPGLEEETVKNISDIIGQSFKMES